MTPLDPAAAEFVERSQRQQERLKEKVAKRETKIRPHETARKARMVTITFPSEAWPRTLRHFATAHGLRLGDLLVWCVSYAIGAIHRGEVKTPSGEGRRQHHRAAEWMDLPWRPEGNEQ